jgi:hypothetical protein
MTSPLESTNPNGIRVVADRAPVREDVKSAFAKGSRKATEGINSLVGASHRRRSSSETSPKRRK